MKISYYPYQLAFRYPFRIAHGHRTHTDCLFIKLEEGAHSGYGECTLPPYLEDTIDSSINFLNSMHLADICDGSWHPEEISNHLEHTRSKNFPIKAAINMALWDLKAKKEGRSAASYFEQSHNLPNCTYTLGVSSKEEMKEKLATVPNFKLFKLKLDGKNDEEMISAFSQMSNRPFAVDANQSWQSMNHAMKILERLDKLNCFLIEQPFPKSDRLLSKELKKAAAIPIIADESFQQIDELEELAESFDGINIKLMKCGGISNAYKILQKAEELDLKILIGCMSESALGCAAAAVLQASAEWVDLDGPYLINNNPFEGFQVLDGTISISGPFGLGVDTQLF